jgi:hypothetical protein
MITLMNLTNSKIPTDTPRLYTTHNHHPSSMEANVATPRSQSLDTLMDKVACGIPDSPPIRPLHSRPVRPTKTIGSPCFLRHNARCHAEPKSGVLTPKLYQEMQRRAPRHPSLRLYCGELGMPTVRKPFVPRAQTWLGCLSILIVRRGETNIESRWVSVGEYFARSRL